MRVMRRALQAKGATVVVACPDKDTCAQTMITLAADFTPADGAWAVSVAAVVVDRESMCCLILMRCYGCGCW